MRRAFSDDSDVQEAIDRFVKLCDQPFVRETLSLASNNKPGETPVHLRAGVDKPRWEVFAERPFLVRYKDALLKGSIDRLVVLFDGDKPVGADIIDFKTDAAPEAAAMAHYTEQLNAYQYAVAKLYGLSPESISKRLLLTSQGCVVRIS